MAWSQASNPCGPVNSRRDRRPSGSSSLVIADGAIVGRCIRPALAHDLGCHALCDLADDPAIAGSRAVAGVTLDVDEARADDQPSGVDPFLGLASLRMPAPATCAIRPPRNATSPWNQALPVPSTMRPPRITTS